MSNGLGRRVFLLAMPRRALSTPSSMGTAMLRAVKFATVVRRSNECTACPTRGYSKYGLSLRVCLFSTAALNGYICRSFNILRYCREKNLNRNLIACACVCGIAVRAYPCVWRFSLSLRQFQSITLAFNRCCCGLLLYIQQCCSDRLLFLLLEFLASSAHSFN